MTIRILLASVVTLVPALVSAQTPQPLVEFYHLDAVGSVRAVTDAQGNVVRRYDYQPFGDGDALPQPATAAKRFIGKDRDAETGLDYFGARYYAAHSGRFTTVDPVLDQEASLVAPQRWNRYAYALNAPTRFVDPDGRFPVETFPDLLSLGASVWSFLRAPSWAGLGYVAWDAAATVVPYAPGSWVRRVAEAGYGGLQAAKGAITFTNALEAAAAKRYIADGVGLLAAGDDQVRQVLGMGGQRAADFLGVTQGGRYILGEAKGSDIAHAVSQLDNTAKALLAHKSNVSFSAELVLKHGQEIGAGYRASGTQLQKFNTVSNKWELVKVQGQPVLLTYVPQ